MPTVGGTLSQSPCNNQVLSGYLRIRVRMLPERCPDQFRNTCPDAPESALDSAMQDRQGQVDALSRSIDALKERDSDLDHIIEQAYEDKVRGDLSADRFAQLSYRYEEEQREGRIEIEKLEDSLRALESRAIKTEDFVKTVKGCKEIRRLTSKLLHQLIDWVEIHQAVKVDGVYHQHIIIHYNCVGAIRLADEFRDVVPIKELVFDTRKGVKWTNSPPQALTA